MSVISRGFRGRRQSPDAASRLPPGQYETRDFPVLSAGPTPHTPLASWDFTLRDSAGQSARWSWDEFTALPRETITSDIHCVTKWSKFDTRVGRHLDRHAARRRARRRAWRPRRTSLARCDGGYTTNVPLADVTGGKAWIAFVYDGEPLPPEHGGPARLLVPHLYFWKSAKWVRELRCSTRDEPGSGKPRLPQLRRSVARAALRR